MKARLPSTVVIFAFVVMLGGPPLLQAVVEARRGEWPGAWQVFTEKPTPGNLRGYEKSLEDASVTVRALRPWVQAAQFFGLRDAGEKALVGLGGWLFYQPGVSFLTQRPLPRDTTARDAVTAVVHFRDQLAGRGIRLVVMPAPNKESVYPDRLSRAARPPGSIIGDETREFFGRCAAVGIEVVDLFAVYRAARESGDTPLYLEQDSHWSPAGMEKAVAAVAEHLRAPGQLLPGTMRYGSRPAPMQRLGDLVRMLRSPPIEERVIPEAVASAQVIRNDTGGLYVDDPGSDVLVLGDSFLRIYQQDEPGGAGFVAHLARALGRPVASLVNDGGASTLVRQELCRRPQLLANTKVVVWEFVERDIRLGTEGWQTTPLPAPWH